MEAELVKRACHQEIDGFAALVQLHTPGLYRFLRARVSDGQLLDDLTQETFLRAWRALPSFRGDSSFRSWLYRIAWNLAVTAAQRRQREVPWNEGVDLSDPSGSNPAERLEHEAERLEMHGALAALSAEDRELVRLLYQDQLSYAEISELMSIPLGTVKVRLHRARQRMRAHLETLWEVVK